MNIRTLFGILLVFAGSMCMEAKMTDQQVIDYVKAQTASGKSEKEI